MTLRILLLACLAALLVCAPAQAGRNQESMFQDDNELLYSPPDEVRGTLDTLKSLGADRLRLTVLWTNVAPNAASYTRPDFDAADPAQYPHGAWDRYDVVVTEAAARGLRVNFNVTGPSPLWANQRAPRQDILDTYEPSPDEFGAFVRALGTRYSGTYARHDGTRLPRVAYWSIWNEPNHSGWLTPQWSADARNAFPRAAALYRSLVGAAWTALHATGHGGDKILVGETAPKGDRSRGIKRYIEAMTFLRALYCVDWRYRRLRGPRAGMIGCPRSRAAFRAENPALFHASGYAHHPYELILSPTTRPTRRNWVTIANLPRLSRALDRIFRRYGSRRRMPLYLTEYGYQTNPPDPLGVSIARQAEYLNQSEYLTWRNRRVKALSQFLLVDDDLSVPASFQSGLLLRDGLRPKRAFAAYRLPIWLPRPHVRRGRPVRVWAMLRPAPPDTRVRAHIEHRVAGSRRWRRLRTVSTKNRRNYLLRKVRVRRSGHLRVTFTPPGASAPVASRSAFVRVHPRR